ncbi:MAG TPA: outer membrane lipid asymmetry maintenance protein MlaD [Deltaproteobacteria bacterium]|nr:outer membrane lipid asymmetry maintenance protein MlaD [Deltaproteobacteria bacterium]
MKRGTLETAVGLFVLFGLAYLAWLSIKLGKLEIVGGDYVPVHADFASASGLKKGASVEIAGVEVGKVDAITLDGFKADVLMKIRAGTRVQEDAIASIRTRGLIGDKYVNLAPGASDRLIPPGGRIRETESSVDLEELIGKFIHGSAR